MAQGSRASEWLEERRVAVRAEKKRDSVRIVTLRPAIILGPICGAEDPVLAALDAEVPDIPGRDPDVLVLYTQGTGEKLREVLFESSDIHLFSVGDYSGDVSRRTYEGDEEVFVASQKFHLGLLLAVPVTGGRFAELLLDESPDLHFKAGTDLTLLL